MTGRRPEGSVGRAVDDAAAALRGAGIDTARLDARVLMAHVLDRDQAWLIGHDDAPLDGADAAAYAALVERRRRREPVAYLTGVQEFWSLSFRITPATLIPRPDTETLVEAAVPVLAAMDTPRILDLGTGSGCLLLALLHEAAAASGIGLDRSPDAVAVARDNARRLGLAGRAKFVTGSWTDPVAQAGLGRFDLIVSNPPYVRDADLAGLEADVRDFEPRDALAAGADGLDAYRQLAPVLVGVLKPGGVFVGEFGIGQGGGVAGLLTAAGFAEIGIHRDAAGRERAVTARLAAPGGA